VKAFSPNPTPPDTTLPIVQLLSPVLSIWENQKVQILSFCHMQSITYSHFG